MTLAAIGLAGALGALARFELGGRLSARARSGFPVGTMVVNTSGAFLTALLVGLQPSGAVWEVLGIGFLGGFTTFSTWMVESARMVDPPPRVRWLVINLSAMVVAGLIAVHLGSMVS